MTVNVDIKKLEEKLQAALRAAATRPRGLVSIGDGWGIVDGEVYHEHDMVSALGHRMNFRAIEGRCTECYAKVPDFVTLVKKLT